MIDILNKHFNKTVVDALNVEEENEEVDLTKSVSRKNNKRYIDNDDDSIISTPIASKIIIKDNFSTKRGKKNRKLIENEEVSTPQNGLKTNIKECLTQSVSKRGRPKKLIQLEKKIETPLKQNEISIRNDVIIEQKTTNDDSVLKNEITASGDIECVVEPLTSNLV